MARETVSEAFFSVVWRTAVAVTQPYVGSDDAADIASQVVLRLWQHRERYPGALASNAELERLTVAASRRALLNHERNRRLRETREREYSEERPVVRSDVLGELIAAESAAVAAKVLAELPPRVREAWRLVHEEGRVHADAAARMGITRQTVNVHLCRALSALRSALDESRRATDDPTSASEAR